MPRRHANKACLFTHYILGNHPRLLKKPLCRACGAAVGFNPVSRPFRPRPVCPSRGSSLRPPRTLIDGRQGIPLIWKEAHPPDESPRSKADGAGKPTHFPQNLDSSSHNSPGGSIDMTYPHAGEHRFNPFGSNPLHAHREKSLLMAARRYWRAGMLDLWQRDPFAKHNGYGPKQVKRERRAQRAADEMDGLCGDPRDPGEK